MQVRVPSTKSRSFWPQSPFPNPCVPIECSSVFRWRPAQGRGLTQGPVVSDGSGNWDPGLMTPIFRLADLLLLFVLLYYFFFLGLGKKKNASSMSKWKENKETEEAGWASSDIRQVLLQVRHSLRFSPFLLTSLEAGTLGPILQMTNLRLTELCKFSRVKHLPLAICTGQAAASPLDDGFPGLKDW